jgi:hypothetical protein
MICEDAVTRGTTRGSKRLLINAYAYTHGITIAQAHVVYVGQTEPGNMASDCPDNPECAWGTATPLCR